jgi:hypothetical protein
VGARREAGHGGRRLAAMTDHKQTILASLEMFAEPTLVDRFIAEDFVNHEAREENRHGREGFRRSLR